MPKLDWKLNISTGDHILDVSPNKRIVRSHAPAPYIYCAEDWTGVDPGDPPARYVCTSMPAARKWLSNRSEIKWTAGTRVVWQKQGNRSYEAHLTENVSDWHSFATILANGESKEWSVWVGDLRLAESAVSDPPAD